MLWLQIESVLLFTTALKAGSWTIKFFSSELDSSVFETLPVQFWYRPSGAGNRHVAVLASRVRNSLCLPFLHFDSMPKPGPLLGFPAWSWNISANPLGLSHWTEMLSCCAGKDVSEMGWEGYGGKLPYCPPPCSSWWTCGTCVSLHCASGMPGQQRAKAGSPGTWGSPFWWTL